MALDANTETFVIYITDLSALVIQIHRFCQTQIRLLMDNRALIEVLPEYLDYTNVFLNNFVIKLFENTGINNHSIKLIEDK